MLPFSIISKYANIAPTAPKIISVQGGATRNSFYILYDNGELYGFYDNFYGAFGNGTRTNITDKFTLINTNVKMFSASDTACVVLKNDNTIWHSGTTLSYTNSNNFNLVPTNITSVFSSIDITTIIKLIVLEGGMAVMLSNSNVYGIGSNSLGQMGSIASGSTLTLLVSGVVDFFGCYYNTGYINSSNDFYITGYNNVGQLGTGNTTNRSAYALLTSGVSKVQLSANGTHVQYLDGSIKVCGASSSIGVNISSGNTTTLTAIVPVRSLVFDKIILSSGTSSFGVSAGVLYSTGGNLTSSLGNTSVYTYNPTINALSNFDGINVLASATYMWKGTDLYYTGATATDPNKGTTNVYTFTKVQANIPYIL